MPIRYPKQYFLLALALIAGVMALLVVHTRPQSKEAIRSFESLLNIGTTTSNWLTYRNVEYGYEFKYPPTWQIEIPSSAYALNKALNIVNPRELKIHENSGQMPYTIYVSKDNRSLSRLETGGKLLNLVSALVNAPINYYIIRTLDQTKTNGLLVYRSGDEPSIKAFAYFLRDDGVYQIVLDPYFLEGHSKEDIETFVGLYSTFSFLAAPQKSPSTY